MTGRVEPEYRPHQPDRRLTSRESQRRSQPRRAACWRCWRSLSRRTRLGSAYPSSSRLQSGSCGPRGSGVLASRSGTNPSLTAALPMAAAPARLAAWCIGRAPRHGRPPRPAGESTRRAPGDVLPVSPISRQDSLISRHRCASGDVSHRRLAESRRESAGESSVPELLTQQQLAKELQVSVRTLERWRREGTGPPWVRVGRSPRYRRQDIDRWLEATRRERPQSG
jgi:excisionase family DNA binding protein